MKVALVTGAGRGIGFACASRLAADGFVVVVADRAGATEAAAEIDGAAAEAVDLADAEQTMALADRVLEAHGRCDVLVNCAAQLGLHSLDELDLETWRRFQSVNLEAPLLLTKRLRAALAAGGSGRIINIISNTIWQPPPRTGFTPYIATKSGLLGMTRSLAFELGADGITVNAVAPGLTPTPGSTSDTPQEFFDFVRDQQAIRRQLAPEDIAGAVAYLASDAAALVTGQAIRVDGGVVTL